MLGETAIANNNCWFWSCEKDCWSSTPCWVMASSAWSMLSGGGSCSLRVRDSSAEEIQSSSLCTSSRSASSADKLLWIRSPCCWAHVCTCDQRGEEVNGHLCPYQLKMMDHRTFIENCGSLWKSFWFLTCHNLTQSWHSSVFMRGWVIGKHQDPL